MQTVRVVCCICLRLYQMQFCCDRPESGPQGPHHAEAAALTEDLICSMSRITKAIGHRNGLQPVLLWLAVFDPGIQRLSLKSASNNMKPQTSTLHTSTNPNAILPFTSGHLFCTTAHQKKYDSMKPLATSKVQIAQQVCWHLAWHLDGLVPMTSSARHDAPSLSGGNLRNLDCLSTILQVHC